MAPGNAASGCASLRAVTKRAAMSCNAWLGRFWLALRGGGFMGVQAFLLVLVTCRLYLVSGKRETGVIFLRIGSLAER
jgi:hypothetical protein